jgi:predicted aldo/keto reductase-like oxidoreductase
MLPGENLGQEVEDNVRIIHESVLLEVQLIDDLLDLTKISRYACTELCLACGACT